MGSLKSSCTTSSRSSIEIIAVNCLVFEKIAFFAFWREDPRWRRSAILDFSSPVMGSLKNAYATSYRSSIDTIALNCLVCEKIAFFCILVTDRRTNSSDALSRSRYRERQLNYSEARKAFLPSKFQLHCYNCK